MGTIDKIRAEVERRMKMNYEGEGAFYAGKTVEDADILDFLITLEKEPVDVSRDENIGLSIMFFLGTHVKHENSALVRGKGEVTYKEACEWIRRNIAREKSEKPMNPNEDVFKIWGTTEKEYLAKSMDKVHLEMEISTYLKDWEDDEEIGLHLSTDNGCIPIELEDVRDLARHFAQWGADHANK